MWWMMLQLVSIIFLKHVNVSNISLYTRIVFVRGTGAFP